MNTKSASLRERVSVDTAFLRTHRGDEITINLFKHPGQAPTICITVDDADECKLPTFEMTVIEAAALREVLRQFCEEADH